MTITKVKTSGWAYGERVKRSEITQLDKNHSYALDGGSPTTTPQDTCESDVTFKSPGVFGKDDHGSFTIEDPSDISIENGVELQIDSNIDTLCRNGYTEIPLNSTGITTIAADGYINSIINLTGNILGDCTVVFPEITGYTKLVNCQFTMADGYYDGYGVSLSLGYGNAIKVEQGSRVIVYCDGSDLYEAVSEGQNYTLVDQVYIKTIPTVLGGPMPGHIQPKQLYPSYLGGVGIPSYVFTGDFTNIKLGKYGISDLGFNDLRVKGEAVFLDGRAGDKFEIYFQCGVKREGAATNILTYIAPLVSYGEGWQYSYYDNFKEPTNKVQEIIMSGAITAENDDFIQGSSTSIFTAPIDGCYQFDLYAYAILFTTFYQNPIVGYGPVVYRVKQWRR